MKILILIAAMLPAFAYAGTEGHGADAIVCRDAEKKIVKKEVEGITYPTLLDFHEAYRIGRTIDLGPKTDSVRNKFEIIMKRLDPFFPIWTKLLREEAKNLLLAVEQHTPGKVEIIQGVQFTNEWMKDLDDDRSVSYPDGCQKEQFVIRSTGEIPDQPDYMIKRDIADSSDNDILTGMVFHEVVFKFSVEKEKILVSPGSRYIVRTVSYPEADSYDFSSYSTILTKAKFSNVFFEVDGAEVFPGVEHRQDGKWQGKLHKKITLSDGAEEDFYHNLVWENGKIDNEATRLVNPRIVEFLSYFSDSIKEIHLRVGDQTCKARKHVREVSAGEYATFRCFVQVLRGQYDYDITATTTGKIGLTTYILSGGKDATEEQKIEKYLTVVKGRITIH